MIDIEHHLCPVCNKYYFNDVFVECPICNWTNDLVQEMYPEWKKCGNIMCLNEAKEAYKNGEEVW